MRSHWRAISCHAAASAKQHACPADLPLAWTVLLINDHLDAQGRLLLFQTCKVFSSAVLQHEGAQLTLSKQTPAQQAQAQALAAGARELCIKHMGKLSPMLPCIHECVTSVELRKITLPEGWAVPLLGLPNLRTLSIRNCQFPEWRDDLPRLRTLRALRKCTVLNCKPVEEVQDHLAPLLAECETLTPLVGDDRGIFALVPLVPALTALQCTPENHISDADIQALLEHPLLEHVVLGKVYLRHDHTRSLCRWKTLHMLDGISDVNIAQLPLTGLEQFIISGFITIYPEDKLDSMHPGAGAVMLHANSHAADDNLRACQKILFKGSKRNGFQAPYAPSEPCFNLFEVDVDQQAHAMLPQLPRLIQAAARYTVGVLALHMCTLDMEVLPLIGELNPGIHTLCMTVCQAPQCFWAGLLAALPGGVRHLVMAGSYRLELNQLLTMVMRSRAPSTLQRITVSEDGPHKGAAFARCVPYDKLSAYARQQVEEMVAMHQPHVTLDWQATYVIPTPP